MMYVIWCVMLSCRNAINACLNGPFSIVELLGCVSCCHLSAKLPAIVNVLHCL